MLLSWCSIACSLRAIWEQWSTALCTKLIYMLGRYLRMDCLNPEISFYFFGGEFTSNNILILSFLRGRVIIPIISSVIRAQFSCNIGINRFKTKCPCLFSFCVVLLDAKQAFKMTIFHIWYSVGGCVPPPCVLYSMCFVSWSLDGVRFFPTTKMP